MQLNSLLNVFVLLICKSLTFSGDFETILGSGKLEAGLFTDYLTDSNLRDFVIEACSPVQDRNYLLTNSFQTGTLINIPEHTWEENYSTKFYMYGWTHRESLGAINSLIWDTLGYGLNKITCTCVYDDTLGSIKTSCFYLDWRDDRYHSGFQYVGYYSKKDFAIIFDENLNDNRFSYRMYEVNNLTRINDNSIVGVWEILQANPPIPRRVKFQPTTPTNLYYENANGHPRLIWNLSEPHEAATYEVQRKVCSNPPKYLVIVEDWWCMQSLPAGTNNWTDNEFQISGTVNQVSYKVRAVSGDGNLYSPSFSNTITVTGEFLPFDRQPSPAICLQPGNPSISIFPNPFNSTIRIALDSPVEPITEMVIFDLKGRAVRRFRSFSNPYQITATRDGRDDQNQPLTSGVYCLLIQTIQHRFFREKIVFIK